MCNFYTMPFVHSMYPIEDTMDWASSQTLVVKGLPGGTSGKEPACQRRRLKR